MSSQFTLPSRGAATWPQGDPCQEGSPAAWGAREGLGPGSGPRGGPGLPAFYLTLPLWHHAHLSGGGSPHPLRAPRLWWGPAWGRAGLPALSWASWLPCLCLELGFLDGLGWPLPPASCHSAFVLPAGAGDVPAAAAPNFHGLWATRPLA